MAKADNKLKVITSKTPLAGVRVYTAPNSTIVCYEVSRFLSAGDTEGTSQDGAALRSSLLKQSLPELTDATKQTVYMLIGNKYIYIGKSDKQSPLTRPINHLSPVDAHFHGWDRVLIFTHSTNFDNNCDMFETVLYSKAKNCMTYYVDNGVVPTSKYASTHLTFRKEYPQYADVLDDIVEYAEHCGVLVFTSFNEKQLNSLSSNMAYDRTLDNKAIWVPEVDTPPKTVKEMVSLLFERIDDDMKSGLLGKPLTELKFLDIACKHGCEFLFEVKEQLSRRYKEAHTFANDTAMNNFINTQLFGLCLSHKTADDAQKTMYGYISSDSNIRYIDGYVRKIKGIFNSDTFNNLVKEILDSKLLNCGNGEDAMKFDVIMGNPPYQDIKNTQVYPYFMLNAFRLTSRYVCMIVKNDWLAVQDTTKEKLFIKCREECFKKRRCTDIVDYSKNREIFSSADVAVCYFLYDKEANSDCHYTQIIDGSVETDFVDDFGDTDCIIKNEQLAGIVKRVRMKATQFGSTMAVRGTPFGISTTGIMDITANVGTEKTAVTPIKLVHGGGYTQYIDDKCISSFGQAILPYWKVICGERMHAWRYKCEPVITSYMVLGPDEACTQTYSLLHVFRTQEEAENFLKYMKTQFSRATVKAGLPSHKSPNKFYFRFLPLQDFTSESDIDWSQSISDIDEQLFKKYKLTADEVAYIKRTIKPMA